VILAVAFALLAAQGPAPDCRDPQTQMEMNACAALDFGQADRELNALWPRAIAAARAADSGIDRRYDRRPTSEAKLREAQRAWIAFRDAHCTWQAYGEARGGSMEPMSYDGCRAILTRERIRQLDDGGE
jgi:uncharacterized protein YecT (DUF1311 family)